MQNAGEAGEKGEEDEFAEVRRQMLLAQQHSLYGPLALLW